MRTEDDQKRRLAKEDRAALRTELAADESTAERLQVFDALARQADDADEEVPEMPGALRDRLVEKFGEAAPQPAPKPASAPGRSTPAELSFFARLSEFFAQKQVAYGGLAIAACVAVLFAVLPRGGGDGGAGGSGGKNDSLRGGGSDPAAAAGEVAMFLFPEHKAAPILALMNPDCPATLCSDAADLVEQLAGLDSGAAAVAADLERWVVITYRDGQPIVESPVEGSEPTDLLIGLRAAADAVSGDE